jgi:CheY-like chemotaxis protein
MTRILIVDDEDRVRSMLKRTLEAEGYSVAEASDGNQALALLEEETFGLVIADILMPVRDGIELIILLRRKMPAVKVIAMSGRSNDFFLEAARELGAVASLAKPFRPSDLLRSVEEALENGEHRIG